MTPDSVLSTNTNLLQTTKFRMLFNRLPNVEYLLTDAELPGVNLLAAVQPTPFRDFPVPGDKLMWDTLNLKFNVDENLQNWMEIFNWMKGLGKPQEFGQYRKIKDMSNVYSDASLILNSSHNNAKYRIAFYDCWPASLSGLIFSTTGSANEPIVAVASFNYLYYEIEKII